MHKKLTNFIILTTSIVLSTFIYLFAGNHLPLPQKQKYCNSSSKIIKLERGPGLEPLYAGGVRELTAEEIAKVPDLKIEIQKNILEPAFTNRESIYLRPIFNQKGGSCAQAAGIGVHYTYALARVNNINVNNNNKEHIFSYFYTWNFLNRGDESGSSFLEGWNIGNENGIPPISIWEPSKQYNYYNNTKPATYWMDGYSNYYKSMKNRFVEINKIDASTVEGINVLKQWIKDGGIASFSVKCVRPMYDNQIGLPKSTNGKPCIPAWGHEGGHVMTIIGWDDNIAYDVDKKNGVTNDRDINNDNEINVGDWEKGAWHVINTWGSDWPSNADKGCYYMLYRTAALKPENAYKDSSDNGGMDLFLDRGGWSSGKYVFTLTGKKVDDKIKQAFTYKVKMKHKDRGKLSLLAGITNDSTSNEPEFFHRYILFNNQGGDTVQINMQGEEKPETIEIGLDAKCLLDHVNNQNAKFFFIVQSQSSLPGEVVSFSLMDYRSGSLSEIKCTELNKTIAANSTTKLIINYNSTLKPLNITTPSLPDAKKGQSYSNTQLAAEGGNTPYKWEMLENIYYEVPVGNETWKITSAITPANTPVDDSLIEKEIPFEFPFFGNNYKKIYIASDGHIMFENLFDYVRSPENLKNIKSLAVLGADYLIKNGGAIYYSADANKVIVRWKANKLWGERDSLDINVDFGCVIYPTGKVEYYYGDNLSGEVNLFAMGASDGLGNYFIFDKYNVLSDIPANHKAALMPETKINGLTCSNAGVLSGTPTNNGGEYHLTFRVTDAIEVKKTKSYILKIIDGNPIINGKLSKITTPLKVVSNNSIITFSFGIKVRGLYVYELIIPIMRL